MFIETRVVEFEGRDPDVEVDPGEENVHPANVEDVLAGHQSVADVGVIGVPDDEWGEVVEAFVQPDGDVTEEELDQWCLGDDDFPDFQRPRAYEFVDEVPRTRAGGSCDTSVARRARRDSIARSG